MTKSAAEQRGGQSRERAIVYTVVCLVAVALFIAFVAHQIGQNSRQSPPIASTQSPPPRSAIRTKLAPTVPADMVVIPAGKFYYGCNESVDSECQDDEKPGRQVTLPAFAIDRTEVTVSAYGKCVRDGRCTNPKSGGSCNWGKSDRGEHPINCVDWKQSKSYCEWKGKHLPSEQEWEKAARGTDGQKYPWGNESASCARAVMDDGGNGCGRNSTWPVGSKSSGASPYGALDMAGNVREWTSSWYSTQQKGRVLRGGSWGGSPRDVRASGRGRNVPSYRRVASGFRCAQ